MFCCPLQQHRFAKKDNATNRRWLFCCPTRPWRPGHHHAVPLYEDMETNVEKDPEENDAKVPSHKSKQPDIVGVVSKNTNTLASSLSLSSKNVARVRGCGSTTTWITTAAVLADDVTTVATTPPCTPSSSRKTTTDDVIEGRRDGRRRRRTRDDHKTNSQDSPSIRPRTIQFPPNRRATQRHTVTMNHNKEREDIQNHHSISISSCTKTNAERTNRVEIGRLVFQSNTTNPFTWLNIIITRMVGAIVVLLVLRLGIVLNRHGIRSSSSMPASSAFVLMAGINQTANPTRSNSNTTMHTTCTSTSTSSTRNTTLMTKMMTTMNKKKLNKEDEEEITRPRRTSRNDIENDSTRERTSNSDSSCGHQPKFLPEDIPTEALPRPIVYPLQHDAVVAAATPTAVPSDSFSTTALVSPPIISINANMPMKIPTEELRLLLKKEDKDTTADDAHKKDAVTTDITTTARTVLPAASSSIPVLSATTLQDPTLIPTHIPTEELQTILRYSVLRRD